MLLSSSFFLFNRRKRRVLCCQHCKIVTVLLQSLFFFPFQQVLIYAMLWCFSFYAVDNDKRCSKSAQLQMEDEKIKRKCAENATRKLASVFCFPLLFDHSYCVLM